MLLLGVLPGRWAGAGAMGPVPEQSFLLQVHDIQELPARQILTERSRRHKNIMTYDWNTWCSVWDLVASSGEAADCNQLKRSLKTDWGSGVSPGSAGVSSESPLCL